MSRNVRVASIDGEERPAEAQEFWRRARIVDATVRLVARDGYSQATVASISERAGVSRAAFYKAFDSKDDALIWAYDAACAYAMPQILKALRAERDWERGAAAAVATYLAILDCDHAWAMACLQEVPAASEQARQARDALRAPLVEALRGRVPQAAVSVETVVLGLDAIIVDRLRHRPEKPLWAGRRELTTFVLAPFSTDPRAVASDATAADKAVDRERIDALLDRGPAAQADFELLVAAAAARRDGPTLWHVSLGLAQRRAAGEPVPERVARDALGALHDAWFFGLPIEDANADPERALPPGDRRYLRYVEAHPGSSGEDVRHGLGMAHLSQVNRALRRLEARGLLCRTPGVGRSNAWRLTASGATATHSRTPS